MLNKFIRDIIWICVWILGLIGYEYSYGNILNGVWELIYTYS